MRSIRLFWLVAALPAVLACGLAGEPVTSTGEPVAWPQDVLACGPDVPDIVASVSTVLQRQGEDGQTLHDAALAELDQLARDHGPTAIACLVDLMRLEWTRLGLSAAPDRAAAAQRAANFLKDHSIAIASNAAYSP